jgi:PAS domain S-box-containing protein
MDGTIMSVNPATARMLLHNSPDELIGKNMAKDIYSDAQQRDNMKKVLMEKGSLNSHLCNFRRRDGKMISAECNIRLVNDEDGHPIAMEGTFRDVTERDRAQKELEKHRERLEELVEERTRDLKESEQKYEDLYENAPDMFATIDAKTGRVLQCNQTLLKKTNYLKKELIGHRINIIYHPDCLDNAKLYFEQFRKYGEVHNAELIIKRKDGSSFEVLLNVTAITDERKRPIFGRSIWVDISESKEAERRV